MNTDKHGCGTALVRCSMAGTCRKAGYCQAGKPHEPDMFLDAAGRCYDVTPYVEGGVFVWGAAVGAEYPAHQPGHGAGRVTAETPQPLNPEP